MSEPADHRLPVAVLKALHEAIGQQLSARRAELTEDLVKQYKANGTDRLTLNLGGKQVATFSLKKPEATCTVSSAGEADYLEYVNDTYPSEIEYVPATVRVRETFRKTHLKGLAIDGDKAIEPKTGEVVPGVVVIPAGDPSSFTLTFPGDGKEEIARAWREGELADIASGLLAIEGGDDDDGRADV
ncbi:hypothetical protein [Streptomyces sp. NPDC093261]|uniref:hypothetical protein n=1 Tax=Streptomyces sp. NPDC093261 TaxID=3366037 RepID=UPI003812B9B2